jgi:transposase
MRIIGADVCKSSVVFCYLESENLPTDYAEYYRNGDNFHTAKADINGLKLLLSFEPDVIAMEPTGNNYSRLWVEKLGAAGVKVVMIGHSECKSYRKILALPDKDDAADALTLGYYYLLNRDNPRRFVIQRDQLTSDLRDRILRLQHLNKVQSLVVNRLKQDLAYAFPERQNTQVSCLLFWGWLAGKRSSIRYDAELAASAGLGMSDDIRKAALSLYANMEREREVQAELSELLQSPQFRPYRVVLSRYGMGARVQSLLISQLYPLENFLDVQGQPIVERSRGRVSRKPTLKHLSERRFLKMLGLAPVREQSGTSIDVTKKAGSSLCRDAMWQWAFTRIEPNTRRLQGEIGDILKAKHIELKGSHPVKLARSKFLAYAARRVFYDLVAEIAKQD